MINTLAILATRKAGMTFMMVRRVAMLSAEPAAVPPHGETASLQPVSACRFALQWGIVWRSVAPRPAQDSYDRGSNNTSSCGRDDEPFLCVLCIAGSRRGRRLSRDAHVTTTALPSASSWPTAETVQYVVTTGSSFGLQRYNFSSKHRITIIGYCLAVAVK